MSRAKGASRTGLKSTGLGNRSCAEFKYTTKTSSAELFNV